MIQFIISYTPLLIGIILAFYALGALFGLPRTFIRFARNTRKKIPISQAPIGANPFRQLLLIGLFGASAYGTLVLGAINFPADTDMYHLTACHQAELKENVGQRQVRLRHIVAAQKACS